MTKFLPEKRKQTVRGNKDLPIVFLRIVGTTFSSMQLEAFSLQFGKIVASRIINQTCHAP